MPRTSSARDASLRAVLVDEWMGALRALGFRGTATSLRRSTAEEIQIVRITRDPFFRVDLYATPSTRTSASKSNQAIVRRVHAAWLRQVGTTPRQTRRQRWVNLACLLYGVAPSADMRRHAIHPPTLATAKSLARAQIAGARRCFEPGFQAEPIVHDRRGS